MRKDIDYTKVNAERRFQVLADLWRFGLWATASSLGSIMLGYELTAQQQCIAMVTSLFEHRVNNSNSTISNKNLESLILRSPAAI